MRAEQTIRYDVEAHWILNLICNFKCEYCISSAPKDPPLVGKLPPERILKFFNSTGKVWLLHLSGGEPFFYPDFVDLCSALSTEHYLSLNSNLASRHVRSFSRRIDPARVAYIHCGVHPEERGRRRRFEELFANLEMLAAAGFPVFASCVMTPGAFGSFEEISEQLEAIGVPLFPKVMRAVYQGRVYPESYSEAERQRFIDLSQRAEEKLRGNPRDPLRHNPTVNPLLDRHFLYGVPDFTGVSCTAGRDFVTIAPDGKVYACGNNGRIGSLFHGTLKLSSGPQPCRSEWCHYTCIRFSALDAARAATLPFVPARRPAGAQIADFVQYVAGGIENRLVQLTLG